MSINAITLVNGLPVAVAIGRPIAKEGVADELLAVEERAVTRLIAANAASEAAAEPEGSSFAFGVRQYGVIGAVAGGLGAAIGLLVRHRKAGSSGTRRPLAATKKALAEREPFRRGVGALAKPSPADNRRRRRSVTPVIPVLPPPRLIHQRLRQAEAMRQTDLVRRARILGMLGSDQAGERASAGLVAHRLVKGTGSSWWQLLSPAKTAAPPPRYRRFVDVMHDPVSAANSRMRQLRRENEELLREIKRLKRALEPRRARVPEVRRGRFPKA